MDVNKFKDRLIRAMEMEEVMASYLAQLTETECIRSIGDEKKRNYILKVLRSISDDTARHYRIVKKIMAHYDLEPYS